MLWFCFVFRSFFCRSVVTSSCERKHVMVPVSASECGSVWLLTSAQCSAVFLLHLSARGTPEEAVSLWRDSWFPSHGGEIKLWSSSFFLFFSSSLFFSSVKCWSTCWSVYLVRKKKKKQASVCHTSAPLLHFLFWLTNFWQAYYL